MIYLAVEIKATVSYKIKDVLQQLVKQDYFSSESEAVAYFVRSALARYWAKGIKLSNGLPNLDATGAKNETTD